MLVLAILISFISTKRVITCFKRIFLDFEARRRFLLYLYIDFVLLGDKFWPLENTNHTKNLYSCLFQNIFWYRILRIHRSSFSFFNNTTSFFNAPSNSIKLNSRRQCRRARKFLILAIEDQVHSLV